jgi:Protein of unknown function (DUF1761)
MTVGTFWPVLATGVASVVIGWAWFHPKVFGSAWMRMTMMTPEMMERGKKRMPLMAIIGLIASMLIAWVMSYVGVLLGVYDWFGALELGFWCWLGFVAPVMLGMVLWEQKPFKLYLITVGYWLVSFLVMALILVLGSQIFTPASSYDAGSAGAPISE